LDFRGQSNGYVRNRADTALFNRLLLEDNLDSLAEQTIHNEEGKTAQQNPPRVSDVGRAGFGTLGYQVDGTIDSRRKRIAPVSSVRGTAARRHRAKVTGLATALQERTADRGEATEVLRGLVDAIVLAPGQDGERLQIELRGNLAAMLGPPYKRRGRRSPTTSPCKYLLVAGARNRLYWAFQWAAA
jgi:hypothetical protein